MEGIVLNLHEPYEPLWNPEAFSKKCNLKLLILKIDLHLSNGLSCLPEGLRVLEWERCPLKSLPLGIQLDELVDIKLLHSKVKHLWDGIKVFQKLKFIDLSYSKYLIQTPNISGVPYLEILILEGCINLIEVHRSIQQHKKLVILNLKDCPNLKILPNKLEMNSLKNFILSGCSKIKKLPDFGDNMECLSMLDLKDCKNLLCLPNSIRNLKSLKILNISGCTKFYRLPNNLNKDLEELDVSGTAIRVIPSSFDHLKNLQKLSFRGCKGSPSDSWDKSLSFRWLQKFQRHPNSIGLMLPTISQMSMLKELDLSFCNLGDKSLLDDLGHLSLLWTLDLSGNNFVNLAINSIAGLPKLCNLKLNDCARLQSLPTLPPSLHHLNLNDCARLQSLPTLPPSLHHLNLNDCTRLQSLPTLPPSLQWLDAKNCSLIEFVSHSQQLCDFFTSPRHQTSKGWSTLIIPGSEIPTWFDNQNYCSEDVPIKFPQYYNSGVSIIVDIPDHCRRNKSWGIAVCLVLEYTSSPNLKTFEVTWNCRAPEAKFDATWGTYHEGKINYPHLLIDILWGEHPIIKEKLISDKNQLEFIFCSHSSGAKEEAKLKIRKCGWRLFWKENVEMWGNALTEPKCIIGNVQCQQDVLEEDEATLSK